MIRLQAEAPLIEALTNTSRIIQRAALFALADESVSEAAVAPLVSYLQNGNPEWRDLALSALARIRKGKEVAVPVLMAMLQDSHSQIRVAAAETLNAYKVPAKTLLPMCLELLSDPDAKIRNSAIGLAERWVLNNDENAAVVPPLVNKARDPDESVRLTAVTALGQIMNSKLRGGAHPRDAPQPQALGSFAPQASIIVPAILQSLSDANAAVRAAAAYALGNLGPFEEAEDGTIVAALTQALTDENKDVRFKAVAALENFGAEAEAAIPVLAGLTNQPNQNDAGSAGNTISRINAAVYKMKLEEILRQKYPRLEMDAAPVQKIATTHWIAETNAVPGLQAPALLIKRAVFRMQAMGNHPIEPADVDFVVFKAPRSGKVWAGREMDFYVETDSTIIGGMLTPWGRINWHDDVADPLQGDVDSLIERFEQRVNDSKIKGESRHESDLRSAAKPGFFYVSGSGQEVMPKFLGVQVSGEEMRLDLENPETGGTASFWIDIKTRKVLKTP